LKERSPQAAAKMSNKFAIVLVFTGYYKDSQDALDLLLLEKEKKENKANDYDDIQAGEAPESIRAKAVVLGTQKSRSDRERAIAILNELARREAPRVDDQFLLAQLYRSIGEWRKYNSQMLSLLAVPNLPPQVLVQHALALVIYPEIRDVSQARLCLK